MLGEVTNHPFPGLGSKETWGSPAHINAIAAFLIHSRGMTVETAGERAAAMVDLSTDYAHVELHVFWKAWQDYMTKGQR